MAFIAPTRTWVKVMIGVHFIDSGTPRPRRSLSHGGRFTAIRSDIWAIGSLSWSTITASIRSALPALQAWYARSCRSGRRLPGGQAVAPFAHARLRPAGETGKTEPQCAMDAVMIESRNALVHHYVRARPGPEALTEDEDLGPLSGTALSRCFTPQSNCLNWALPQGHPWTSRKRGLSRIGCRRWRCPHG